MEESRELKRDVYLTIRELADWLNYSVDNIRKRMKNDPEFPKAIKFSERDHRWKQSEVQDWISKKEAARS